ncbi:MAG: hypothetical protein E7Z94_11685 [Actinomyces ruminicola]|nr:hypothetical protein [Actinomyces ruminicola]
MWSRPSPRSTPSRGSVFGSGSACALRGGSPPPPAPFPAPLPVPVPLRPVLPPPPPLGRDGVLPVRGCVGWGRRWLGQGGMWRS